MSTHTDPAKYMSLDVGQVLDDGNTVGVIEQFQPAETTITYTDVGAKFRLKAQDEIIGDDDSTIFVASDDGELSLGYGPHFDSTIVTNVKRHQLKRVIRRLREAGNSYTTGDIDVHFDHAGPIVFEGEIMIATTPVKFPWDFPSPDRPCGPTGPSITGGGGDE